MVRTYSGHEKTRGKRTPPGGRELEKQTLVEPPAGGPAGPVSGRIVSSRVSGRRRPRDPVFQRFPMGNCPGNAGGKRRAKTQSKSFARHTMAPSTKKKKAKKSVEGARELAQKTGTVLKQKKRRSERNAPPTFPAGEPSQKNAGQVEGRGSCGIHGKPI